MSETPHIIEPGYPEGGPVDFFVRLSVQSFKTMVWQRRRI